MTDGFKEEDNKDAIVICGYDNFGETVTKFLQSTQQNFNEQPKYIAFDLDPELVIKGYKAGKKVLYGDGSQPMVLSTAGVDSPRAFVVTYEESETCIKAVERIREAFPDIPIFARYVSPQFFCFAQ